MAGKLSDAEKNFKVINKFKSSMVKISPSKSILSYHNGSALNVESRECTTDEGMPGGEFSEETSLSEETFTENQNLNSECLDSLRKKLISDLSLTVFSTDLENKLTKMEPIEISQERQSVIQKLIVQISQLSDAEKLLLYLKLPSSTSSPFDPLRQPLNPLGNRQEIQQTIVWIKTHLEEDSEISIPKQDVYDQYLKYCENVSMKPLSTADFGKVMKQVYPGVRPRRLGTRGNSRYCYSGMRSTCKLPTPILPQTSIENSVLQGNLGEGSISLTGDATKCKKTEKTKRKWKSSSSRSDKCTNSNRASGSSFSNDTSPTYHLKKVKRSKTGKEKNEIAEGKEQDNIKENGQDDFGEIKEVNTCGIKREESSDNSFSAFDLENGLSNDFGIYFENMEKVERDSLSRSAIASNSSLNIEDEEKQQANRKSSLDGIKEPQQKLFAKQTCKSDLSQNDVLCINGDHFDQANTSNNHIENKVKNAEENRSYLPEQLKASRNRSRRSASFSRGSKNLKKSYVPIQPKPVESQKINVLFERSIDVAQKIPEETKESERSSLCEESDSQEPEEEIVRYFKHLEENEINASGLINQAVKNVENSIVQISNMSQSGSKNLEEQGVLTQTNQLTMRCQSSLESQREVFNLEGHCDSIYVPRSQSLVELPSSSEQIHRKTTDTGMEIDGKKKKVSHLRILLEKSVPCVKYPYSTFKEEMKGPNNCNFVRSDAQMSNAVNQTVPEESSLTISNFKSIDQDVLKLGSFKIVPKGPSLMPQSLSTRTKYFSFTPISPGPQSPLKTPTTPSASPFVSPHSTPVPRFKQSSRNDFFIYPSDKKPLSMRPDHKKNEFSNENTLNFSKTILVENKPSLCLQGSRPRSSSSTNFCRSKVRKNLKAASYDRTVAELPKIFIKDNSQFPVHRNFVSSDSLSTEVRRFLENNSELTESQCVNIRSQSVPLNRMISESSWPPVEASPAYYFNSDGTNPTFASVTAKVPGWVTNSDTNSPKEIMSGIAPFVSNGEIANLEPSSFSNEVFTNDRSMVHLNENYFGDFPRSNEEAFPENKAFRDESTFSNKIELSSNGSFDSAFASGSDPAVADNIKSYLPDFEGLDNQTLGGSPVVNGETVAENGRKFFKNVLYEGGNDNIKDPVITSFKPVLMNDMSTNPDSPVLNFFETKLNEDNQQLIEFFDFVD